MGIPTAILDPFRTLGPAYEIEPPNWGARNQNSLRRNLQGGKIRSDGMGIRGMSAKISLRVAHQRHFGMKRRESLHDGERLMSAKVIQGWFLGGQPK
jgi:hypothetical protein